MIKAIIYDHGGVIVTQHGLRACAEDYATKNGLNKKEFGDFVIENWQLAKVNTISSDEFWVRIAKYAKKSKDNLRTEFIKDIKVNEEMVKIIKKLHESNKIKLLHLSNHIEDWLESEISRFRIKGLFHHFLPSYRTRLAKPNRKAYQLALDALGTKAEETIFVDDMERNTVVAMELGINVILFDGNVENFRKKLISFGISI